MLLHDLKLGGHVVKGLEADLLGLLMLQTRHGGVDSHELERDLLARFLDLVDGFLLTHDAGESPSKCPGWQAVRQRSEMKPPSQTSKAMEYATLNG